MYGDRVVIPLSLRSHILQVLHSALQGTSGMEVRACTSSALMTSATTCRNAPSQRTTLAAPPKYFEPETGQWVHQ